MAFLWKLTSADRDTSGQYFIPDAALPSLRLEKGDATSIDWQERLPELSGARATLRELRAGDAIPLFSAVMNEEVTRFISPPPATVEGFEQFIIWAQRQRAAGCGAAFAIVPRGSDAAIGLFQLRSLQSDCSNAEWGFVMASEFWGSGIFFDSARLVIDFAFGAMGVRRLEARAAMQNGRGNAALLKLRAVREGVLRKSFLCHGEVLDQAIWTILADEWCAARRPSVSQVIH
jgi:[ribosomal protein S5]-alanine N-acetyltransferase